MRINFLNNNDRLNFFDEIRSSLKLKNWQELAIFLKTHRTISDKYRLGAHLIPKERFNRLLKNLGEARKSYYLSKISEVNDNWGAIIGGKKAYKINKRAFDEGRKIGNKGLNYKPKFDINMPLSPELCEFIGTFIGDGFTNKYGSRYQVQITGDRVLDLDYHSRYLKGLSEKIFNYSPKINNRTSGLRFNIYSKALFEMLTKRFNFPAGLKSRTVRIPNEILESQFINSTLMGMFDTDGGISFDKRKIYKKPYIKINYTSVSEELIKQICMLFDRYKIPYSVHKNHNAWNIQISGVTNTKKFISIIGFSNKRHLDKLNQLTE